MLYIVRYHCRSCRGTLHTRLTISTLCRYLASNVEWTICCPSASSWAGFVLYFLPGMVITPFVLQVSIALFLEFSSAIICDVYYLFYRKNPRLHSVGRLRVKVPICSVSIPKTQQSGILESQIQ